jgi:hypothetical protein
MSPQNLSPLIAVLLILGGSIACVLGGLHAIYTLLDLRNPRWLVPVDPSVAQAMANSALRLSRGGTDMWRAWIGSRLHDAAVRTGRDAPSRVCD